MSVSLTSPFRILIQLAFLTFMLILLCFAESSKSTEENKNTTVLSIVQSAEELNKIVESAGAKLLMFDLYADWCMPCKILSPMLENIAKENREKVAVYKIDVDKNPEIAGAFGVTGLPFVVMVKNKVGVHAFTGVQSKDTYVRAINQFSGTKTKEPVITPDGEIVKGVRVINITTVTSPGKIYVYRGETVKLVIGKVDHPYSIHIPEYGISTMGTIGKDLEVTFKVKKIGVFPVFCNGKCPSDDGARFGYIVVLQYKATGTAKFTEVTTEEAKKLITKINPLILDVRTPNEYHSGHIENAKLIPVQQLESRLSELEKHKNKEILVYCRSGNRSTVASEILIRNGFKKLYNLRQGMRGWK